MRAGEGIKVQVGESVEVLYMCCTYKGRRVSVPPSVVCVNSGGLVVDTLLIPSFASSFSFGQVVR